MEGFVAELELIQKSPTQDAIHKLKLKVKDAIEEFKKTSVKKVNQKKNVKEEALMADEEETKDEG
jgi:hypothetical protein